MNQNKQIFIHEYYFENVSCKTVAILSLPQCVKSVTVYQGGKGTRDSQTCVPFTNMD